MAKIQATGMTPILRSTGAMIAMEAGTAIEGPSKHFSTIIQKSRGSQCTPLAGVCFIK